MGGGGGGGYRNVGDVNKLLAEARERLKGAGRKNLFISFIVEDEREVNLLRAHARNENSEIEFNDWSVREPYDSANADYIKQKITDRIQQSSMTVVYISPETHKSPWVKWEIDKSIELGKRVIAVHAGISRPSTIPQSITDHNISVIPWSELSKHI